MQYVFMLSFIRAFAWIPRERGSENPGCALISLFECSRVEPEAEVHKTTSEASGTHLPDTSKAQLLPERRSGKGTRSTTQTSGYLVPEPTSSRQTQGH
jgi:hypothetical protein